MGSPLWPIWIVAPDANHRDGAVYPGLSPGWSPKSEYVVSSEVGEDLWYTSVYLWYTPKYSDNSRYRVGSFGVYFPGQQLLGR